MLLTVPSILSDGPLARDSKRGYAAGREQRRSPIPAVFLMRWSDLRTAVLSATCLCILQGCGFEPLLAAHSGKPNDQIASIQVASIEGRTGQVLRNDLIESLTPRGEPDRADYTLVIRIEEPRQNLAFQRNNSISFVAYGVTAYWSLVDNNGKTVLSSTSSSSQQYAVSNSQYATAVSASNTRDLVATEITQDVRNQLAQFFYSQQKAGQTSKN
jgi:LPS-assembly lipoprotein